MKPTAHTTTPPPAPHPSSNIFDSAHWQAIAIGTVLICIALTVGLAVHKLLFRILARFRHKDVQASPLLHIIASRLRRPALLITLLTMVGIVLPFLNIDEPLHSQIQKAHAVAWLLSFGWVMISGVYVLEGAVLLRYGSTTADDVRARRIRTQLVLMRRLGIILLAVLDAGLILSLFRDSAIWQYGAGLLASAGLASLVLATAAKSTAENLLAGLQIAFSEPIRLDDVVIVEGEYGKIEEITTTYVVVALWDYRRLIVPLTYFIEKPFQNWTRDHADLMGTVFLYVDYTVPIEALRTEFLRLLEAQPLWDGKVKALQVTNLTEHSMEIRCLLSAKSAGDAFDLRCIIREGMIVFLQTHYPEAFPRTRFSAVGLPEPHRAGGGVPLLAASPFAQRESR